MWSYTYCPLSSRFRDFSKKNQHHWNSLQHRDSISVSIAAQCVHLHHQFTPAGPCSGSSSYRLSLSNSFRSCSWLFLLFALRVLLAVFCLVHVATCTCFEQQTFKIFLCIGLKSAFSRGLTRVSHGLTALADFTLLYFTYWQMRPAPSCLIGLFQKRCN